jgi:hypothetical protein
LEKPHETSCCAADLGPVAVLGAVSVALIVILFRPLLLSSVSPELGEPGGVSARLMEVLFLGIVALATAMALPVVGALLVFSLMVGPAASARALTNRPLSAMLLSAAISVVTVWASIALSFVSDWPIGFFVAPSAPSLMRRGGHGHGPAGHGADYATDGAMTPYTRGLRRPRGRLGRQSIADNQKLR